MGELCECEHWARSYGAMVNMPHHRSCGHYSAQDEITMLETTIGLFDSAGHSRSACRIIIAAVEFAKSIDIDGEESPELLALVAAVKARSTAP